MRLMKVRVTEFKSVQDSGEFGIGDVTCLVGKNESGKTALLQAIYRLNPVIGKEAKFEVTPDYPRNDVEDYRQDIETERRDPHDEAVWASFALEDADVAAINAEYGEGVIKSRDVELTRGYDNGSPLGIRLDVDESVAVKTLVSKAGLPDDVAAEAKIQPGLKALGEFLAADATRRQSESAAAHQSASGIADENDKAVAIDAATKLQESNPAKTLRNAISGLTKKEFWLFLWEKHLEDRVPQFLYFDEYYQMTGQVNVQRLIQREAGNALERSDHPMLGLIDLARLKLGELTNPQDTQELKSKLEGASSHLSKQILKYWSQNKHLQVRFDLRPALPKDPAPEMNQTNTMNLWGEVHDKAHGATLPLSTRSKGFVWFFSFLAWFSQQKKRNVPLILLLDEPGLVLHASAQSDLLRYIESELKPYHQVIYTTHSPFMVDVKNFDRVRIVRDKSMEADEELPKDVRGTKVYTDILEVDTDSLFPLQGALGYDIAQALFVGPNCLIIEGVSDLLYLDTISNALRASGREGLSERWTLTPVGGSDKVSTFASLLRSQKNLNVATLIDVQKKDQQAIENLYKKKLLKKQNVRTFAEFTKGTEADIEDMFDRKFYVDVVNAEYKAEIEEPISLKDLGDHPRVLVAIEQYVQKKPFKSGAFNHYRPARYFSKNAEKLTAKLDVVVLDRFETAFKELNALL